MYIRLQHLHRPQNETLPRKLQEAWLHLCFWCHFRNPTAQYWVPTTVFHTPTLHFAIPSDSSYILTIVLRVPTVISCIPT